MKADIVSYVARCLEFQQVKDEHRHLEGLLQLHAISKSKWEVILMDFIVGFPLIARRHDLIFMVVHTLSKSAHFILVHMTYHAPEIERVFINDILRLHGMPKRIISDRGSMFTRRFWTSFQEALGTQMNFSIAYHRDRWEERKNEPNFGRYIVYVRDGLTKTLGRVLANGRVCIQQQLSKFR
jgi:hypothetical protein